MLIEREFEVDLDDFPLDEIVQFLRDAGYIIVDPDDTDTEEEILQNLYYYKVYRPEEFDAEFARVIDVNLGKVVP
jgi:hypothetical protein